MKLASLVSYTFPFLLHLFYFCGVCSVLIGTLLAIRQRRLKRFIIYSSIAQMGFPICALSANSFLSMTGIYLFLLLYVITSITLWTMYSILFEFKLRIEKFRGVDPAPIYLTDLSNFAKINPLWGFCFVILFFSMAGIPPLAGFFAKILLILSLIDSYRFFGSGLLVLISAISVYYYLRVIKVVAFESKNLTNKQLPLFDTTELRLQLLVIIVGILLLVCFTLFPSTFFIICHTIVLCCYNF